MTSSKLSPKTLQLQAINRRLLAIEKQLTGQVMHLVQANADLKVQNALLVSTTRRLLGENDALRRNQQRLEQALGTPAAVSAFLLEQVG